MQNRCKTYRQRLILYMYDELSLLEKSELELHLTSCSGCRQALEETKKFYAMVPREYLYTPSENELKALRNTMGLKLQQREEKKRFSFTFLAPKPVYQIGFALFLIAFGFLLGRTTLFGDKTNQIPYKGLITANEIVQTRNSAINPILASVDKLKFDPETGEIEISYNTINDIRLRGNSGDPEIRQMLRRTLLEENSPAIRLHAVKAIASIAESENILNNDLISGIEQLLETEENPGVRLLAVKILKMLPLNKNIQNIFLNIILYDDSTPLRMEALEALSTAKIDEETEKVLHSAVQDSNSYIRMNAKKLLEREENKTIKIEREG